MKVTFKNKTLNIPDSELENNMKALSISKTEAIQLWLEDNDYLENTEVEALTKKAKENHAVQHGAVNPNKPKSTTRRERKPDIEKETLIKNLSTYLETFGYSVKITNKSKIIEFEIGENHYKLDLIKQRPSKTS